MHLTKIAQYKLSEDSKKIKDLSPLSCGVVTVELVTLVMVSVCLHSDISNCERVETYFWGTHQVAEGVVEQHLKCPPRGVVRAPVRVGIVCVLL